MNCPIHLSRKWRHQKFCFLKKPFSTTFGRLFVCFLLRFTSSQKIAPYDFFLKRRVAIIYLGHGDNKGCVFRIFFDNFYNESLWISCSDLQVLEKIAQFNLFSKRIVPFIYLGNGDTKSCVFLKNFFRQLL